MNNTGIFNSQSHQNKDPRKAGLDIKFENRGKITRAEVAKYESLICARLTLAVFHGMPKVRIQELQKQVLMLKTLKASL
jgi:hypothetical protein